MFAHKKSDSHSVAVAFYPHVAHKRFSVVQQALLFLFGWSLWPEWKTNSQAPERCRRMPEILTIPQPSTTGRESERAKLTVRSGLDVCRTLSSLSIRVTLASRWHLWDHVCGRGLIALSTKYATLHCESSFLGALHVYQEVCVSFHSPWLVVGSSMIRESRLVGGNWPRLY